MVTTDPFQSDVTSRGVRMLRTALEPAIAGFLDDPTIVEVMLNPDWLVFPAACSAFTVGPMSAAPAQAAHVKAGSRRRLGTLR